jgi:hypothetical protein
MQRYGDAKEQTTLALFEADSATFQEALQRVLIQLAGRSPVVAAELQALAQQDRSRGGTNQTVPRWPITLLPTAQWSVETTAQSIPNIRLRNQNTTSAPN